MKVNLDGLLTGKGAHGYGLEELAQNLWEVRSRHLRGESREVLDNFFKTYVFGFHRTDSAKSSSSGTAPDQVIGTAEAGHSPSAGEKP